MNDVRPLAPRQPVPDLVVPTVDGGPYRLADQHPERFSLIAFYRGYHCLVCRRVLRQLHELLPAFAERGVETVAVSSDEKERARRAHAEWRLPDLWLGYGLDLDAARRWGLYVSTGHGATRAGVEEPALFTEPGLFLVRPPTPDAPNGVLYCASVQTMPFARPHFDDVLQALDFVVANDYPARGEVTAEATEDR